MLAATGQQILLASLTTSIVAIICLAVPDEPSQAQDDANTRRGQLNEKLEQNKQPHIASLINYLVPDGTYSKLVQQQQQQQQQRGSKGAQNDARLLSLLDHIGPDMKPANGFADPPNITLDVAKRAWQLMHDHAEQFAGERINLMWPIVRQALVAAEVSDKCLVAAEQVASSALKLKTWAVKLLNSWGTFPPVGLFEGTLGDIGSYHGCLGVPENEAIRHAHYCTFSFRPVLPTRRDYELLIAREPTGLLELFNETDSFSEFASKSHYNHYVYYKLGTCFPIDCSPLDAQKVARLLAKRAILISGPVKCHTKFSNDYEEAQTGRALKISSQDLNNGVYIWKPHINRTQLVALVCLGTLMAIILLFTLVDLFLNRLPKMCTEFTPTTKAPADNGLEEPELEPSADDEIKLGALTVMNHVIGAPVCQLHTNDQSMVVDRVELSREEQSHHENSNNNGNSNNNKSNSNNSNNNVASAKVKHQVRTKPSAAPVVTRTTKSFLSQLIHDCSLITNTKEFFHISKQQLRSDILCMNGLRCITMSWIILAHTVQYNDWAAFGRIYEIEAQLKSLLNQPIFNASYLVDTFFVMSGLLTSYTVFKLKHVPIEGTNETRLCSSPFSTKSYLIGRYLRLTPQILLVSLLFILLPLSSSSSGPHWESMTGEYSENCSNNWWVNLLHIQAFYKSGEMCNFVCWWISVDMLYHLIALAVILIILKAGGAQTVPVICSTLILFNATIQAARHYQLGLPPNLLSTIPQTGAMWAQMTLKYFWTPNAHLFPFVFGFQLGFYMARNKQVISGWFTQKRAMAGWVAAIVLFGYVSFGTHFWVVGQWRYSAEASTFWALSSQIVWSTCVAWTIVACQFGYGGFINQMLSCKLFIVLGKASYLVYLSHFLILFTFFGSQNLLLEPTQIMITYIILGNICLSMAFGSFLCVAFEMPWLKIQKRIMRLIV
uniref:Nose resistant to fluoxetine protein 6 n=1 Tax=Aceria tosichella TaxID=561515 RepID=A0A6G1SPL6_9ACAR